MGHELFIESLLRQEALSLPVALPCDGRRLLGSLGGIIEYYFEQDVDARFSNVVYPLATDSWFASQGLNGKRFWDFDKDQGQNFAVWADYRRQFQQQQPIRELAFRLSLQGGEVRHYSIDARPIHDKSGRFSGYCGVVRDITQQRSDGNYVDTVEHAAIGIAHIGRHRRLTFVNRKLCEILGYSRDELLGMDVDDLSHEDDRNIVPNQRQVARDGNGHDECIRVEKRYRRKDGGVIWVRLTITHAYYQGRAAAHALQPRHHGPGSFPGSPE